MSYSQNFPIVTIDYVQKLNENENTENIIHAIPLQENNEISIIPLLVIERNTKYKYRIISTSVILCCFSIIIITIAVNSMNRNNYHSLKGTTTNFTSFSH